MTKYNFGYDIKPGSTMDWAFHSVKPNSLVLEWGPAIGTLTKHLKEEKKCLIDIIELDMEAGKEAAQYARNSFLGEMEGDLDSLYWYDELKNEKYDYIIILDVLEHLKRPKELLWCVETLLKEDGVLLLSVPNIAHNSVVIELLNNQFPYTNVGLLDETHVRFYTHDSLCQMLESVNLYPFVKDAIQLRVGENELNSNYDMLPSTLEAFLRTRDYADVYQFLFKVRRKKESDIYVELEKENLPYTLYQLSIYDETENRVYHKFINPKNGIEEHIKVSGNAKRLRVDLLNAYCVVENFSIVGIKDEKQIPVVFKETNMMQVDAKWYALDENPQVFIEKQDMISEILIKGDVISFGDNVLNLFAPVWRKLAYQRAQLEDIENQQKQLYSYIEKKEQYVQELLGINKQYEKTIQELREILAERGE